MCVCACVCVCVFVCVCVCILPTARLYRVTFAYFLFIVFRMQSYGTIVTGRSAAIKVECGEQALRDSETLFGDHLELEDVPLPLEWNFGFMDVDWLRGYCKTQVNALPTAPASLLSLFF